MEDDRPPARPDTEAQLRQQIQQLQERLAFYEGFDTLIQDNVTHARELFRLAATERAAASLDTIRSGNGHREDHLRSELEAVSRELISLASSVEALSQRVAAALGEANASAEPVSSTADPESTWPPQRAAIVVHGVASARSALSLQRFVHALPQVSGVKTREFAGGVLRLDADLSQPLKAAHFAAWDRVQHVQVLTDRPDVFEFAVEETEAPARLSW
ncbi:MAG: hypothetical protein KC442_05290 [Thermomicrobiales bacterium]|nr:hypothetical protein [Thermomicrobiales bacterium]